MFPHDLPLRFCEFAVFEQDAVGHTHFPNVVQECAPPDIDEVGRIGIHRASQLEGQLSHPLRVTFGFPVAQIERAGPAFNRRIVGKGKIDIGALQALEQFGVVDRYGSLSGQRSQKLGPLRLRVEWRPMEASSTPLTIPLATNGTAQ